MRKYRKGIRILFLFSFVLYISTAIFLHSYNSTLLKEIVENEEKIKTLTENNNLLRYNNEILKSEENVKRIASEHGLKSNPDNVIFASKKVRGER